MVDHPSNAAIYAKVAPLPATPASEATSQLILAAIGGSAFGDEMDTSEKVAIGALAGLGLWALMSKKTEAAEEFTCPYGDELTFPTLEALQAHVLQAHPGERIPISIQWH